MRVGIGWDIHKMVEGRRLVLGGVEIPFEKGLEGHSDADALLHAIIDALLGAAEMSDIGTHFPDSDPAYKDISSVELLDKTRQMLGEKGRKVANIDCIIFAQQPKMAEHIPAMKKVVAETLGIEVTQVNVKAKTTEGLGLVGDGSAIAAQAVALIE